MNLAFAIVFVLFFYVITYPLAKNFQLCGYDIKYFFKHFFVFSYCVSGKNKLIFTNRMIRLAFVHFIFVAALTSLYFFLLSNFWWIALLVVLEFVILPLIFMLSAAFVQPFENFIKKRYLKRAKKILSEFCGKKIAITGSFGKTTTKNFLVQILQTKYKVCFTPKNYNTPMGLCKTALEELKGDHEIFIAEMGARRRGDISELMDLFRPTYGILTAIGQQHLETFGTVENVIATKNEICEHMSNGGTIVFDCSNENVERLYYNFSGNKVASNVVGGVRFEDIKYSSSGCECAMFVGKKKHVLTLSVIGREILKDLACAVAMALELGIDENTILNVLPALKPSPHRLEMISNAYCTVIDDSYNSNLAGAMQACECLQLFNGKRIIVSPGLVEQGDKQYELNYVLGKTMGRSCDEFVVMNETNKKALFEGARASGMKENNIHFAQNRKQQEEILKQIQQVGSVVLFENDLPDNYR